MSGYVYLIVSGEYSGYCVSMAFPTRELAERFCERENFAQRMGGGSSYGGYSVEECDLHERLPEAWLAHYAEAFLEADGTLGEISVRPARWIGEVDADSLRENVIDCPGGRTRLWVNYRRSDDEARKALQDLAARVKAERAGIAL